MVPACRRSSREPPVGDPDSVVVLVGLIPPNILRKAKVGGIAIVFAIGLSLVLSTFGATVITAGAFATFALGFLSGVFVDRWVG